MLGICLSGISKFPGLRVEGLGATRCVFCCNGVCRAKPLGSCTADRNPKLAHPASKIPLESPLSVPGWISATSRESSHLGIYENLILAPPPIGSAGALLDDGLRA